MLFDHFLSVFDKEFASSTANTTNTTTTTATTTTTTATTTVDINLPRCIDCSHAPVNSIGDC